MLAGTAMDDETLSHYIFLFMLLLIPFLVAADTFSCNRS